MVQWYNGAMVQWYNGTMVQWYNGAMVQRQDEEVEEIGRNKKGQISLTFL
jgi:hypothetical protein